MTLGDLFKDDLENGYPALEQAATEEGDRASRYRKVSRRTISSTTASTISCPSTFRLT